MAFAISKPHQKLINTAKNYAIDCHTKTNHLYDGKPYSYHLNMVVEIALSHIHLLEKEDIPIAISACWCHDLIEDTRQSYNDVKAVIGSDVADIVYILTNEKGKTRQERANDKYYRAIKKNKIAAFVKVCDRFANIIYSDKVRSKMKQKYKGEAKEFKSKLYKKGLYDELWSNMENYLNGLD